MAGLLVFGLMMGSASLARAQVSVGGDVQPSNPTVPSWEVGGLTIGSTGTGTLNIEEGGSVSSTAGVDVGSGDGSAGTINMNGGDFFIGSNLSIGSLGQGVLGMVNDATVTVSNAMTVGGFGAVPSSVTMDASTLNVGFTLSVGGFGNTKVDLTSDSKLTSSSGVSMIFGSAGSEGKVTVDDSTLEVFSLNVANSGKGTLIVKNDGVVSSAAGFIIARNLNSQGRVEIQSGELNVGANYLLQVGGTGNGELIVSSGGTVTADSVSVAYGQNGTGNLVLNGGSLTVAKELAISGGGFETSGGIGRFTIQNGAQATSETGWVGYNFLRPENQQGYAEVFQGSWTMTGRLSVSSTLKIHTGGTVTNGNGEIANWSSETNRGEVIVDGGTWTNNGVLLIAGVSGETGANGVLNVSNGGTVSNTTGRMATVGGSLATARIDGGTWNNTSSLTVGESGHATVTVANGGTLSSDGGNGVIMLGKETLATGILNIGGYDQVDTAGVVQAAEIRGGSGVSQVNFNQTNATTFGAAITGPATVVQRGSGSTTLTRVNTFTGNTRVLSGTLILSPTASLSGTPRVEVFAGATLDVRGANFQINQSQTLAGGGTILGDVTVAGNLSPGFSPGLMSYDGDLMLTASAIVLMELGGAVRGAEFDAVNVMGDLAYGGMLTISLLEDFTPSLFQTFELFNVTGLKTGNFSGVTFLDEGWAGTFDPASGLLTITASAVPEPASIALLGFAACAFVAVRARRMKNAHR